MSKALDIYESQMDVGQVKTISTGSVVDYVELLFSPTTKAQFLYNDEKNVVQICFSDTDLQIADLLCEVDKETLYNLIVNLKTMYNQLS